MDLKAQLREALAEACAASSIAGATYVDSLTEGEAEAVALEWGKKVARELFLRLHNHIEWKEEQDAACVVEELIEELNFQDRAAAVPE